MGYILFPVLVMAFFTGIFAVQSVQTNSALPDKVVAQSLSDAQQFLSYRDAVAAYLQSNPAFTGSVSSSTLVARGTQFSSKFLASAGNAVIQIGAGPGRVVTVYAGLSAGAISSALALADNDASLGMASGGKWRSYAQGAVATPQPLVTAVPDGSVVSVVQFWN